MVKKEAAVLSKGYDLYCEMQRRGLQPHHSGRDQALYFALADELKFAERGRVASQLKANNTSAEQYLLAFLRIAEPFALMFKEIWDYLGNAAGSSSAERISVKFGKDTQGNINLEQFRKHITLMLDTYQLVSERLWTREALSALLGLGANIAGILRERNGDRDSSFRHLVVPPAAAGRHPFDMDLREICSVINAMMDDVHQRSLMAESKSASFWRTPDEPSFSVEGWLRDLLPYWQQVVAGYHTLTSQEKNDFHSVYANQVQPLLSMRPAVQRRLVRQALDMLSLPFWSERWHTYEIWASVVTLRSLGKFSPQLCITDGYVPIDGYKRAVVASLSVVSFPDACVTVQHETPVTLKNRRGAKPDLRVCFADSDRPDDTACVVEFKQRKKLTAQHVAEVFDLYSHACPKAAAIIVLNYDDIIGLAAGRSRCVLLGNVRPGNSDALDRYRTLLVESLNFTGFRPKTMPLNNLVILLDTSASMGAQYRDDAFISTYDTLRGMGIEKIARFDVRLFTEDFSKPFDAIDIVTANGTDIQRALKEVERMFGRDVRLLVVTDEALPITEAESGFAGLRGCLPKHFREQLTWIAEHSNEPLSV